MNFLIELDRWGIKEGLPTKPYVDADYIQADKNIQGINNALQFAANNNYSEVILPKGIYALCYPREIIMVTNLSFNLNGSTLKVIYDSNKKSPFDNRTTTDYYNFKGISFVFSKVSNSYLCNGEIVGCREDRSFLDSREVAQEHSYGVVFRQGASYNTLRNCTIRDYMGDNISFLSTGYADYAEFDPGLTVNSLDYATGLPITNTGKTLISKFLNLPQNIIPSYQSMYVAGAGYARTTNLNNKNFDIFFYDQADKFIGVHKKRRIYSDITIPVNAKKIRFQFFDETVTAKNLGITLWYGPMPSHNTVTHCEIYNGHRGGITGGGSYNVIEHNTIRDNGKALGRFIDGKPIFNDPTRYSINMEDSYGANCVIRHNEMYGSYHGILVGCYDIDIYDNTIHNIDNIAINIYGTASGKIRGNTVFNSQVNLGLMSPIFYSPLISVTDNTFVGGTTNMNVISYRVSFSQNQFRNPASIFINDNCSFWSNHIVFDEDVSGFWIKAKKIKDCTFKSTVTREITLKTYELDNCEFENLRVRIEPLNNKLVEICKIHNSEFTNCEVRNHIFSGCPLNTVFKKCKLTDTATQAGITNTDNQNPYTLLEDCQLVYNSKAYMFLSETNRQYTTYKAVNCKVIINNQSFNALLSSGLAVGVNELILENNDFVYTGSAPLTLKPYLNKNHIRNFVDSGNTFTNIVLV
ncbi:right-handed parallel beta-helix repeat-containing protein [Bacillus sp. C1]